MADRTAPTPSEAAASKRGAASIRKRFLTGLIGLCLVPAAAGALTGWLGGGYVWLLDLFNHFWMHFAAFFAATTVALMMLGGRRLLLLSVVMLVLSLWHVWPVLTSVGGGSHTGPITESDLSLLHFNVNTSSGDPLAVAGYLANQDADIVFLQEVSQSWLDALEGKIGAYDLVIAEPRSDNFGIACFVRRGQSRVTIKSAQIVDQTGGLAGVPAIELEVGLVHWIGQDAQPITVPILSVHTLPPVSRDYAAARDAQLAAAGRWAQQAGENAVVIGDLNATPWSKPFVRLLEAGELGRQHGFGRQTTWPAALPHTLGIPIDHCLHGRGFNTIRSETGAACGSDHRPLHVTLRQSGC